MRSVQGAVALPGRGVAGGRDARRVRAALIGLLVTAAVAAGVFAALEGTSAKTATPAAPAPAVPRLQDALLAGVALQQANCANWLAATPGQRSTAVRALTAAVGGMTPSGPATTLTAAQADGLFGRWCATPIARHFLLYELYIRAAGFASALPKTG